MDVSVAADYQLPKVLRHLGVLTYSPKVAGLVDNELPIVSGSPEERAIRAATVLGAEELAKHLGLSIPQLDSWLWLQRNAAKAAKFHLTETTYY